MALTAGFFYLFAALSVASAVMVIVAKNPVHAVLFLILAFFNAAGLFVLLGAEFLAMLLVIVYVGAVAVLFLFVVMMLDVDFAELRAGFIKNSPIGAIRRRHRAGRADPAVRRLAASASASPSTPARAVAELGASLQYRSSSASSSTPATSSSSRWRVSCCWSPWSAPSC